MSPAARRLFPLLLLCGSLLVATGRVQARSAGANFATANAPEKAEEGEGRKHEELFKVINFLLLAGGLAFLLRKPLAEFFTERSASIRQSLEEGRKAVEASQAQFAAVEEKLRHLEEELREFKAAAGREMEAERQRLRQAAAEEAEKILQAARAQIETSTRAARVELKVYAAQQAIELAEEMIRERLDEASRRRLVAQFMANLEARESRN